MGAQQNARYVCVLCFYLRTFDRDQLEPVRACLERSIVTEPEYSEALVACLVYSNARRFAHPNEGALGVEAGALPPKCLAFPEPPTRSSSGSRLWRAPVCFLTVSPPRDLREFLNAPGSAKWYCHCIEA